MSGGDHDAECANPLTEYRRHSPEDRGHHVDMLVAVQVGWGEPEGDKTVQLGRQFPGYLALFHSSSDRSADQFAPEQERSVGVDQGSGIGQWASFGEVEVEAHTQARMAFSQVDGLLGPRHVDHQGGGTELAGLVDVNDPGRDGPSEAEVVGVDYQATNHGPMPTTGLDRGSFMDRTGKVRDWAR